MKVKVRCVKKYFDIELNRFIEPDKEDKNYERIITRERANEIIEKTQGAIEILNVVKEDTVIETTKLYADGEIIAKQKKIINRGKKTATKKKTSK